jgi:hypothetical protein
MTDYAALAIDASYAAHAVDMVRDPGGVDAPLRLIWLRAQSMTFGASTGTMFDDHKRGEIRRSEAPDLAGGDVLQAVTLVDGEITARGQLYEVQGDPSAEDDEGRVWTLALLAVEE